MHWAGPGSWIMWSRLVPMVWRLPSLTLRTPIARRSSLLMVMWRRALRKDGRPTHPILMLSKPLAWLVVSEWYRMKNWIIVTDSVFMMEHDAGNYFHFEHNIIYPFLLSQNVNLVNTLWFPTRLAVYNTSLHMYIALSIDVHPPAFAYSLLSRSRFTENHWYWCTTHMHPYNYIASLGCHIADEIFASLCFVPNLQACLVHSTVWSTVLLTVAVLRKLWGRAYWLRETTALGTTSLEHMLPLSKKMIINFLNFQIITPLLKAPGNNSWSTV